MSHSKKSLAIGLSQIISTLMEISKIEKIENGDTLILSGSVPKGIESNIYQKICKKLEKKELALKDIKGCECQAETTKKIKKIDEKLGKIKNAKSTKPDVIKETTTTTE